LTTKGIDNTIEAFQWPGSAARKIVGLVEKLDCVTVAITHPGNVSGIDSHHRAIAHIQRTRRHNGYVEEPLIVIGPGALIWKSGNRYYSIGKEHHAVVVCRAIDLEIGRAH